MTVDELNTLDPYTAARELLRCCGSTRWARAMAAARPYDSADAVYRRADEEWRALTAADVLEAFAAHPKIGTSAGQAGAGQAGRAGQAGEVTEGTEEWSQREQAGVQSATDDVRQRLVEGNRAYEARFGYIFIICATGKSASEMLAALEARLRHSPDQELLIAAEQQRQITRLRLAKLLETTA